MSEKNCILVVDDEEDQRKSLTLLLKRKGFETEQAGSGKEALAIAQGRHIDLTLLDIRLPDIDGIQLLAPLKKTNPDMVIIMITGFASVESAVQSLTAGASSYITKPINLEELFLKIKNALDHQHLVDNVRRAEEELKVSLAKYKVLFESFPIAITISDRKGNIVESNRMAEEILGLSADEQSRRKIDGTDGYLIRPDGTPMPAEEYASVRALKENHLVDNIEMGIVKGTGPVTWINVTAAPIPVNDYGVAIAYSDITDRKMAEIALKDSETYLKMIFNSTQTGLLIIDPVTHSIYDVNPAAMKLIGRTKNELIGTICHQFVCPAERGKCPITDLGQKIDNSERILLRADGKRIPILKTVVPIVIQDHSYLLESFVDITDRKVMESEIRSLNAVLEQRVKERTEALSKTNEALEEENAQRIETEKKLQVSNDEKVLLLKEIHHRVKNNLQIIVSLLRLQKRQIADTATQQQILDSESRIRSMALVHEKLYRSTDFASINFEDYLKTLVNQLVSMYATNPGQIRIIIDMKEISVDINQSIPLGLIMNELISNAMKYAFPEGRKGELSISGIRQGGSNVFTIRDNGIGIPGDFDWRETKSLGMHLVIMLTDQLDGTIELEKGEGTLFRLTLPEKIL